MASRSLGSSGPWRRVAAAALAVGLIACSAGDDDGGGSGVDEPRVTAAGPVVPEVVCTTGEGFGRLAYFGYTNEGSTPVALPVGPSNEVVGPDGDPRTTGQPEVLAPGPQGVVFWVPLEGADDTVTWTLVGDDGEERSATASLDPTDPAPLCPDGPTLDPPDERSAEPAAAIEVTRDPAGVVTSATIEVVLSGLDEPSRCPAGDYPWTADRPEVDLVSQGTLNLVEEERADGATLRLIVADPHSPIDDVQQIVGFASVYVVVDVEDRCHDANGAIATAWAASPDLQLLSQQRERLCFGVVEDGEQEDVVAVDCSLGPGLALTGGFRVR